MMERIDNFIDRYCYSLLAVILGGLLLTMSLAGLLDSMVDTTDETIGFFIMLGIGAPVMIGGIFQGFRKWLRSKREAKEGACVNFEGSQ